MTSSGCTVMATGGDSSGGRVASPAKRAWTVPLAASCTVALQLPSAAQVAVVSTAPAPPPLE